MIVYHVEADEPPDSLPAYSPAATVVREGAAAAVYQSLAASGRNHLVVGSSSSSLASVPGL